LFHLGKKGKSSSVPQKGGKAPTWARGQIMTPAKRKRVKNHCHLYIPGGRVKIPLLRKTTLRRKKSTTPPNKKKNIPEEKNYSRLKKNTKIKRGKEWGRGRRSNLNSEITGQPSFHGKSLSNEAKGPFHLGGRGMLALVIKGKGGRPWAPTYRKAISPNRGERHHEKNGRKGMEIRRGENTLRKGEIDQFHPKAPTIVVLEKRNGKYPEGKRNQSGGTMIPCFEVNLFGQKRRREKSEQRQKEE